MAVGLRFTDGTTTVTVSNGTTGYVETYNQSVKSPETVRVVDEAQVVLMGGLATVRTTVLALNNLFYQAGYWQKFRVGKRVYVERDLGDGTWWRSELTGALPVTLPNSLDIGVSSGMMEFSLVFERMNWWEGAEAQVNLNSSSDWQTSPIISGADVAGDLPAPCRIQLQNTDVTNYVKKAWLGHVWGSYASLDTDLLFSDATRSGGTLDAAKWEVGGSFNAYWSLSSAVMAAFGGRYFKPIIDFYSTTNMTICYLWLTFTAGGVSVSTPKVIPVGTDLYHELPAMRLMPYNWQEEGITNGRLYLYGAMTGAGNVQLSTYINIIPMQGFRKWAVGNSILLSSAVGYDDGMSEQAYVSNSGGSRISPLLVAGRPIRLMPGQTQRIYPVIYMAPGFVTTVKFKVYYRPRRLVI